MQQKEDEWCKLGVIQGIKLRPRLMEATPRARERFGVLMKLIKYEKGTASKYRVQIDFKVFWRAKTILEKMENGEDSSLNWNFDLRMLKPISFSIWRSKEEEAVAPIGIPISNWFEGGKPIWSYKGSASGVPKIRILISNQFEKLISEFWFQKDFKPIW